MTTDDDHANLYRSLGRQLLLLSEFSRPAGFKGETDASQSVSSYSVLLLESLLVLDNDFSPNDHRFASAVIRGDDAFERPDVARGGIKTRPRFAYEVPPFF